MSKFFVFALLLVACLCFVSSASVGLLDAHSAIQRIIAEYEKQLPGPSVHHAPEVATFVDPNNFHLNF